MLIVGLLIAGCSRSPTDYRLDDPPGPADSAVMTLGSDISGIPQLVGRDLREITTLPAVYSGSGPGSVDFDPSGRYAAIHGETEPNGVPATTSLLDLTTGEAVQLRSPERCDGGPGLEFATDSRTLIQRDCDRVRLRKASPEGWVLTGDSVFLHDHEGITALSSDGRILTRGHNRFRVRSATTGALLADYPVPREITADEMSGADAAFDVNNRPVLLTERAVWPLGGSQPPLRYHPGRCRSPCGVSLVGTSPHLIAWTVPGSDDGAEIWTLDATHAVTQQGAVSGVSDSGTLTFVAARVLSPGPDFLRTPQVRR